MADIKDIDKEKSYKVLSDLVINECHLALDKIDEASVDQFIDAVLEAEKVFFIGVGRVMLSLQAIAKRFSHLGVDTYCVGQITEPAITEKDLLIVGSGSGESLIPVAIASKAHELGVKIAYIGASPESRIKKISDYFIYIPVSSKIKTENIIESSQLMTSLFEQSLFLLGDVMAQLIVDKKGIDTKTLWQYHANLE